MRLRRSLALIRAQSAVSGPVLPGNRFGEDFSLDPGNSGAAASRRAEPDRSRRIPGAAGVLTVGLIADTHGLLRPEALEALRGSDRIIHAGDIGAAWILETLAEIAPVVAVRGNNDKGPWADALHETCRLDLGSTAILVIHDLSELAVDPLASGLRVVVSGHSHRPLCREEQGILFVNPGSAGPRRFSLPVTLGRLSISDSGVNAELLQLQPAPLRR